MYVYSNDAHIYIRLNQYTYEDLRRERGLDYSCNTEVLAYDWEGNWERIFQTDTPIKTFFVDDNEENLFGMTLEEEDFRLRRFHIND